MPPSISIDADAILGKLSDGKDVFKEELQGVEEIIIRAAEEESFISILGYDALYSMVLIVGIAGLRSCTKALDILLNCKEPTTVSCILKVLCEQWNESESIFDRLIMFSTGVPWDVDQDVRTDALWHLGRLGNRLCGKFSLTEILTSRVTLAESSMVTRVRMIAMQLLQAIDDESLPISDRRKFAVSLLNMEKAEEPKRLELVRKFVV